MDPDSPFASLLRTNNVPSAAESSQIKALLIDQNNQLSKVNKKINDSLQTLDRLYDEQEALISYIEPHLGVISTLRRLPADTLSDIFFHCLPDNGFAVRSVNEAPLLLTRVCRRWREVALSTPLLWCALHIHIPSQSNQLRIDERLEGIKMWLDRSRSSPLSLSLTIEDPVLIVPQECDLNPLVAFYVSLCHRWRGIQFDVPLRILKAFAHLRGCDVPLLEKLLIRYHSDPLNFQSILAFFPPDPLPINQMIAEAPNLCALSFSDLPQKPATLPVAWRNLTGLTLRHLRSAFALTTADALSILIQTPRLQYCDLDINPIDETGSHALVRAQLPFLHTLSIHLTPDRRGLNWTCLKGIFDNLSASVLVNLNVTLNPVSQDVNDEVPFLSLPLHQLEALKIILPLSSNAMHECLRQMPALRSLDVEAWINAPKYQCFSDYHLELLGPTHESGSTLCPLLQNLTLTKCDSVSDEGLLRFLQPKLHPTEISDTALHEPKASQLRSLKVTFGRGRSLSRDIFQAHVAPLELKERGIRVQMYYHDSASENDRPYDGLLDPTSCSRYRAGLIFTDMFMQNRNHLV